MKAENSIIGLVVVGCVIVAFANQMYQSPDDNQLTSQGYMFSQDTATDFKSSTYEADQIAAAKKKNESVGNILRELHPDEVVLGDPVNPDWPSPEDKGKSAK